MISKYSSIDEVDHQEALKNCSRMGSAANESFSLCVFFFFSNKLALFRYALVILLMLTFPLDPQPFLSHQSICIVSISGEIHLSSLSGNTVC